MLTAIWTTVGLGFIYFISAAPAGMALGLSWPLAALSAWAGYSLGGVVVAAGGVPLRRFLARRFGWEPDRSKRPWLWKVWDRAGLPGLGLLAPVTVGPQAACLLALSLGESATRTCLAISAGCLPWALGLAWAVRAGVRWWQT